MDTVKAKRGCKIIPIKCTVQSKFQLAELDIKNIKCEYEKGFFNYRDVTVGYIAIKANESEGVFYFGYSYCNPEDLPVFGSKYGRRLAYKRCQVNCEKRLVSVNPYLLDKKTFRNCKMSIESCGKWTDIRMNIKYIPNEDLFETIKHNLFADFISDTELAMDILEMLEIE